MDALAPYDLIQKFHVALRLRFSVFLSAARHAHGQPGQQFQRPPEARFIKIKTVAVVPRSPVRPDLQVGSQPSRGLNPAHQASEIFRRPETAHRDNRLPATHRFRDRSNKAGKLRAAPSPGTVPHSPPLASAAPQIG